MSAQDHDSTPGNESAEPIAERIGRYDVEGEVARGGMGIVYRVRDPELRRTLAMKVLMDGPGEGSDASTVSRRLARFLEEAQLTGQLDHPGIVPVHELGRNADGQAFFTMQLVKGRTFRDVIDEVHAGSGTTRTRALGIVQKVCEAMAFAHDRGVIHRDLKPANVMVGRFGETYVMDWGLAKILGETTDEPVQRRDDPTGTMLSSSRQEESVSDAELITLEGDVMGTPTYMAPEQARGDIANVGTASDVYSVGAMLYHLLAGSAPYVPRGEERSSIEVLQEALERPPEPLASVARDVPGELVSICERAMQRDPGARYASMMAMADDLQAFLEDRVVSAHATGALVEFKKWVVRNRGIAASLLLAVVLAIGGLAAVGLTQARGRAALFDKNKELEDLNEKLVGTNAELEIERAEATAARDDATAARDEAIEQEREARWQSYAASVTAAALGMESGAASESRGRLDACPEELRGWEWEYLSARLDSSDRVLRGPGSFQLAIAASPDGAWIASGGGQIAGAGRPDFAIRIWDSSTGEMLRRLDGHRSSVTSLAFSASGAELVSATAGGGVALWDAESGTLLRQNPAGNIVDTHPDGIRIAIASHRSGLHIWDPVTGETRELSPDRDGANANDVAFSPDGRMVALARTNFEIEVWDVERGIFGGTLVARTHGGWHGSDMPRNGVLAIAFSGDSRRLAAACSDNSTRVFHVRSAQVELELRGTSTMSDVAFSPGEPLIATANSRGDVRLWDANNGRPRGALIGHDGPVLAVEFDVDGNRLISSSVDTTLRIWTPRAVEQLHFPGGGVPKWHVRSWAFDPDGRRIVRRATTPYSLDVIDLELGLLDLALPYHGRPIVGVGFSPDGSRLCTIADRIRTFEIPSGELVAHAGDLPATMDAAEFDRELRHAAAWFRDDAGWALGVWDVASGALLHRLDGGNGAGRCGFDPSGTKLVSVNDAGRVTVFEIDDGASELYVASGTIQGGASDLAFAPDGSEVAIVSLDVFDIPIARLELASGAWLPPAISTSAPASACYHPTARAIVVGNWDKSIAFTSERGNLLTLRGDGGPVTGVRFDPTGRRLASQDFAGSLRMWEAIPARELQARQGAVRADRFAAELAPRLGELFRTRLLLEDVIAALEREVEAPSGQVLARIVRTWKRVPTTLATDTWLTAFDADRSADDRERALRAAHAIVDMGPASGIESTADLFLLGAVLVRYGRFDDGLAVFADVRGRAPTGRLPTPSGTMTYHPVFEALAYVGLDDREAAVAAFRRAEGTRTEIDGDHFRKDELTRGLEAVVREARTRLGELGWL